MRKEKKGLADDYKLEIEQALETAIKTPVGSDSLEAKVVDVEVPETVEQLLEYAKHETSTEYRPEVRVYEEEQVSSSYLYDPESLPETVGTESTTASYSIVIQENEVLQNAEAVIASAITQNTFGVSDFSINMSVADQEKLKAFKEQNQAEWFHMYHNASWLVMSI